MATSIEDCKAYIAATVNQQNFTVISPESLIERCWQAVWPIIEQNAGNLDWFAESDPQFTGLIAQIIQDYQKQQHDYDTRDRYAIRKNYPEFVFESFNVERRTDGLHVEYIYRLGEHRFAPQVTIGVTDITKFDASSINTDFLHELFFNFGIINAINYYKLSFSPKFIIKAGSLSEEQCAFFKKLFYHGLEECMYRNELQISFEDFLTIEAPSDGVKEKFDLPDIFSGNLIPVGGGKDSVVTLEALRPMQKDNLCLQYNRDIYPSNAAALDCVKLAGYAMDQIVNFNLTLDPHMLELNQQGFYNGHIPFSSCLAFASLIMAYLNQKKYIVLSNESSANEGNIAGTTINHQYSKSFEFEQDFDNYVKRFLTNKIHYFSLLRCLNEYQIVQKFIEHPLYLDVFRSCNVGQRENRWCSNCAKCLYVYIMLYPFVSDEKLSQIFGRNLLEDLSLADTLRGLTHPDATKPFDCVGTRQEICYAIEKGLAVKPYQRPALYDYYDKNLRIEVNGQAIEHYYSFEHNIPTEYLNLLLGEKSEKVKQAIVDFLKAKRILILGFGREGKSALKFIRENLPEAEIAIADQQNLSIEGVTCFGGPDYLSHSANYDVIIKSPGVAIKDALDAATKAKITSSTDLFLRFCGKSVIGVTATKGKSTTASLIHHILQKNHKNSVLAGNIGRPCLDVIDELSNDTIIVLEISGHQLEYVQASPHIAILLNLYEEHFDHFTKPEDYFTAKKQIFHYQDADDLLIYGDIFQHAAKEEIAALPMRKIDLYHDQIVDFAKIHTHLIGKHYLYDIAAAIAACKKLGLSETDCLNAVADFRGLPHRLEYVGTFRNIKFFNDSIATAQEATINAIKALPDTDTLILGGMNRKIDYRPLVDFLRQSQVRHILLLPDTNTVIRDIFASVPTQIELTDVANLDEAVQRAYQVTAANHCCLLSPAAASYNSYKNFEERGDDFCRLVKKYATLESK